MKPIPRKRKFPYFAIVPAINRRGFASNEQGRAYRRMLALLKILL